MINKNYNKILGKNRNLDQKSNFFTNIEILDKIGILDKHRMLGQTFSQTTKFWAKIVILYKNCCFGQKGYFEHKSKFWTKIEIFDNNRKFEQTSKAWRIFFDKPLNFGQKS